MPDFITLTCPTCGSKLKVTEQIHLLACAHCGNEHMVIRDSGTLYLAPLAADVRGIRVGVDKTAAELAVARLGREIEQLEAAQNRASTTPTDEWSPPSTWEKFFSKGILITVLFGVLGLITTSVGLLIFAVVAFAVSFGAYMAINGSRVNSVARERKAKLNRITSDLSTKYEQYRKNRQIAES